MIVSGAEQAPHLRAPWISANKSRQNLPEFPVLYCTFQVNAHRYLSNLSSSLGQHTSSPPPTIISRIVTPESVRSYIGPTDPPQSTNGWSRSLRHLAEVYKTICLI
jgi:hypothetical protein